VRKGRKRGENRGDDEEGEVEEGELEDDPSGKKKAARREAKWG
jgi:hypothetical protein